MDLVYGQLIEVFQIRKMEELYRLICVSLKENKIAEDKKK